MFSLLRNATGKVWRITTAIQHFNALRPMSSQDALRQMVKPSGFQKYVLVSSKVYKSPEEVPDRVSALEMKRAMDKFRGRTMIAMTFLSLLAFFVAIRVGRYARDSGDSLTLRGTMQEVQWREKGKQEELAAAQKSS